MQCYAIKDETANLFQSPYFLKSEQDAVRGVRMEVNNPQSILNQFPEEFSLYRLGVVDMNTGILTPHLNGPEKITSLSILLKSKLTPKSTQSQES